MTALTYFPSYHQVITLPDYDFSPCLPCMSSKRCNFHMRSYYLDYFFSLTITLFDNDNDTS